MRFKRVLLDDLHIEDEPAFRHVGLYHDLKQALRRDGYRFRVPVDTAGAPASWDRVVFLNLTFWDAADQGDVLSAPSIPADVVAHVAWHHLARRALARAGGGASAGGLFLGEAIASAFDLYLVGRLLGHAPDAQFLETQVPRMAEIAEAAGLSDDAFEALLEGVSADPERAFEDMRELLFDAATALVACEGIDQAAAALARFDEHRFAPLLHHFELSSWVLYARAYTPVGRAPDHGGGGSPGSDPAVRAIDEALRAAPVALDWLAREWLDGA